MRTLLIIFTATPTLVTSCFASNLSSRATFDLGETTFSNGFAQDVVTQTNALRVALFLLAIHHLLFHKIS